MGVGRMAVDDAHRIPEKDDIMPPEERPGVWASTVRSTAVAGLFP